MARTKYTPEQRAERAAADKALRDAAAAVLDDPVAVAAMTEALTGPMVSKRVAGYSDRNRALLWTQATERGITLTDVDSFRGWRERGRCVRKGERALRIVAPKGKEDPKEPTEAITVDTEAEAEGKTRFRMVPVFDVSQTDGFDDVEPAETVGEPAAPAVLGGAAPAGDRVREILAGAELDGLHLRVVEKLGRDDYVAVNKVLQALGGKWNRKAGAHVFPTDPAAALAEFIAGGAAPLPARTGEGYVATPADLADELVALFSDVEDLPDGARVLEPSAGDGALVRAILAANPAVRVVAVEPNTDRAALIGADPRVEVVTSTFEAYAATAGGFDQVVMNPPFAMPGQPTAWIDHVQLAWRLLNPNGRVTAIVPNGFTFRQDKRHQAVRELIDQHGGHKELPDDAFTASGTKVRTVAIWADHPTGGVVA